ncbi:MAG: methylamine utilization protein [Betaproteobacteria bacterium]|nr:methylamine utilization protein [Betaproteobacteria bacterium]
MNPCPARWTKTDGGRKPVGGARALRWSLSLLAAVALPAAGVVVDVQLKAQDGAPAKDAAVYAVTKAAAPARARREVLIEQIGKQFVPQVSIVQTGTSVNFPNRDPIRHHVYSFSPAKNFEIKLYSGVPANPVVFDKPGEVVLGCNIHDHMIAWVLVVDSPYFAKTDAAGVARLDLPAGDYDVHAWFPGATKQVPPRKLSVGAQAPGVLTFSATSRYGPPGK